RGDRIPAHVEEPLQELGCRIVAKDAVVACVDVGDQVIDPARRALPRLQVQRTALTRASGELTNLAPPSIFELDFELLASGWAFQARHFDRTGERVPIDGGELVLDVS